MDVLRSKKDLQLRISPPLENDLCKFPYVKNLIKLHYMKLTKNITENLSFECCSATLHCTMV